MKIKAKPGDTVYLSPTRDNARSVGTDTIVTGAITKVGRKYITVTYREQGLRFDKETLQQETDYSPDWELYFSEQDVIDARVAKELRVELWKFFSQPYDGPRSLTRDQLERIMAIIGENLAED